MSMKMSIVSPTYSLNYPFYVDPAIYDSAGGAAEGIDYLPLLPLPLFPSPREAVLRVADNAIRVSIGASAFISARPARICPSINKRALINIISPSRGIVARAHLGRDIKD